MRRERRELGYKGRASSDSLIILFLDRDRCLEYMLVARAGSTQTDGEGYANT